MNVGEALRMATNAADELSLTIELNRLQVRRGEPSLTNLEKRCIRQTARRIRKAVQRHGTLSSRIGRLPSFGRDGNGHAKGISGQDAQPAAAKAKRPKRISAAHSQDSVQSQVATEGIQSSAEVAGSS